MWGAAHGYSLPKEVRKNLAAALRRFWPASRVVLIVNEHIEKPDFADAFVYGVEGPEALIEAVASAVEKSRSALQASRTERRPMIRA